MRLTLGSLELGLGTKAGGRERTTARVQLSDYPSHSSRHSLWARQ